MEKHAKIILLDGSKGAGKTTVGEMLVQCLTDMIYLSVDNERRAIGNREGTRAERNREAFEKIMEKSSQYLDDGISPIIDCGWVEDRISRVDAFAKDKGSCVYKFLLKASYETQLERVRSRDSATGKKTDEERFAEIHTNIHSKDFSDFTIFDTDLLTLSEIVDQIVNSIPQ